MGNLAEDVAVTGGDGAWRAAFSPDWEIWGPNGGYVAAVALQAAGAHSGLPRPASLLCHYLGVGAFDEVQIETTTLRKAKRAESVRVSITQQGAPIAEALVWCIADELLGMEHDAATPPDVPSPHDLKGIHELDPASNDGGGFSFGRNFEHRPVDWVPFEEWAQREVLEPKVEQWMRYRPQPTFTDAPYVDAARSVILLDTYQWPAATRAYRPGTLGFQAPSLDLSVSFHELDPSSDWLLVRADAPVARDGLVGGRAEIWSESGRLLASGGQQMLCRPMPRRMD